MKPKSTRWALGDTTKWMDDLAMTPLHHLLISFFKNSTTAPIRTHVSMQFALILSPPWGREALNSIDINGVRLYNSSYSTDIEKINECFTKKCLCLLQAANNTENLYINKILPLYFASDFHCPSVRVINGWPTCVSFPLSWDVSARCMAWTAGRPIATFGNHNSTFSDNNLVW